MHPRIIAIPLTRPQRNLVGPINSSFKLNSLIYYQFQFTPDKRHKLSTPGEQATNSSTPKSWFRWSEEGFVNSASHKAAEIWAGFGRAQGGWRLKLYHAGGKLVDRLDFEELALKSIDPSLGPSIMKLRKSRALNEKEEKTAEEEYQQPQIPLLYPPSIVSSSTILSQLRAYAEHRIPRHKRGFYLWMLVAPFMAPFMLIPIIPNIPFFFCAWRSWSHYRAYRASQYLQSLLQHNMITPEASEALDQVYRSYAIVTPSHPPHHESSSSSSLSSSRMPFESSSSLSRHELLLTRDAVPAVLEAIKVEPNSTVAGDLYRAIEQARMRVENDKI